MRRAIVPFLAVVALVATATPAWAEAPPNDSPSTAVVIESLPFTHEQSTVGANANGPRFCSNNNSVFFTYTAAETVRVQVDTFGSDYDTVLGVYRRNGGVREVRCNDDRVGLDSGVRFWAREGRTYYIMVGECCGNGRSGTGGNLVLHMAEVTEEPLDATLEFTGGTYDTIGGSATLTGTITCTATLIVRYDGVLRQVRDGLYLARGFAEDEIFCVPGDPIDVETEIESETSFAFGAGNARFTYWAFGTDGFNRSVELADRLKVVIELIAE